jgi:hypothetical protein
MIAHPCDIYRCLRGELASSAKEGVLMFKFLKSLFVIQAVTPPVPTTKPVNSTMNEGDMHSGPHGYSPNTEYTETQYGSRFDEEAEWNEEH